MHGYFYFKSVTSELGLVRNVITFKDNSNSETNTNIIIFHDAPLFIIQHACNFEMRYIIRIHNQPHVGSTYEEFYRKTG